MSEKPAGAWQSEADDRRAEDQRSDAPPSAPSGAHAAPAADEQGAAARPEPSGRTDAPAEHSTREPGPSQADEAQQGAHANQTAGAGADVAISGGYTWRDLSGGEHSRDGQVGVHIDQAVGAQAVADAAQSRTGSDTDAMPDRGFDGPISGFFARGVSGDIRDAAEAVRTQADHVHDALTPVLTGLGGQVGDLVEGATSPIDAATSQVHDAVDALSQDASSDLVLSDLTGADPLSTAVDPPGGGLLAALFTPVDDGEIGQGVETIDDLDLGPIADLSDISHDGPDLSHLF